MDPFEAPYWNIVQLIVWVATGDYQLVAIASDHAQREEFWVEGRLPEGDKVLFKKSPDHLSLIGVSLWLVHSGIGDSAKALEEAQKSILRALASGEIQATGLLRGRGGRSQIEKSFWKGVAKFQEGPWSAQSDFTGDVCSEIRVLPEEALRGWPSFAEEVTAASSSARPALVEVAPEPVSFSSPPTESAASTPTTSSAEQLQQISQQGLVTDQQNADYSSQQLTAQPSGGPTPPPAPQPAPDQIPLVAPSRAPVAEPSEPMVNPYKTGAAGRPTISHLIKHEFDRRREAGETETKLTDEAAALQDWAAKMHPTAKTPTVTTIQNQIRSAHLAYRASQPKPTKSPTKPTKSPTK